MSWRFSFLRFLVPLISIDCCQAHLVRGLQHLLALHSCKTAWILWHRVLQARMDAWERATEALLGNRNAAKYLRPKRFPTATHSNVATRTERWIYLVDVCRHSLIHKVHHISNSSNRYLIWISVHHHQRQGCLQIWVYTVHVNLLLNSRRSDCFFCRFGERRIDLACSCLQPILWKTSNKNQVARLQNLGLSFQITWKWFHSRSPRNIWKWFILVRNLPFWLF